MRRRRSSTSSSAFCRPRRLSAYLNMRRLSEICISLLAMVVTGLLHPMACWIVVWYGAVLFSQKSVHGHSHCSFSGHVRQDWYLRDLRSEDGRLRRSLLLHPPRSSSLPYWLLQDGHYDAAGHLQGMRASLAFGRRATALSQALPATAH